MKEIWNPEICHGIGKSNFEGWYYKFADSSQENVIAIIPGFSSSNPSHAFIQVFNGTKSDYQYIRYSIQDFKYKKNIFEVSVSNNHFSLDKITLNFDNQGQKIKGELYFKNHFPWPVKRLSPGAMGPFGFLPFMECSHGVLSFDHEVSGSLMINENLISFDGGRGYIEKDWGRSFPKAWIWMQSNHFSVKRISFMVSIARIPYLGMHFTGFLAGFLYQGKIHLFTTYNRSKLINLMIKDNIISFTLKKKNITLDVEAIQSTPVKMKGPVQGEMKGKVLESLTSTIKVNFFDKKLGLHFTDIGTSSGLEIMAKNGDL